MEIFTCPKGHIVSADKLKCVVSTIEPDIEKGTVFICDVGTETHSFTLKTAIRKKMFTKEQAERIKVDADKHRRKYGYKEKEHVKDD